MDIIAPVEGRLVSVEVKCRQEVTGCSALTEQKGILEGCKEASTRYQLYCRTPLPDQLERMARGHDRLVECRKTLHERI